MNSFLLFLRFFSIYSTNYKLDNDYDDHSRVVSVDASKRHRDERLSKIVNDFSFNDKYDENRPLRRDREKDRDYDRRYKNPDPKHGGGTSSRSKYADEEDEDDIVTMMDRLNRWHIIVPPFILNSISQNTREFKC